MAYSPQNCTFYWTSVNLKQTFTHFISDREKLIAITTFIYKAKAHFWNQDKKNGPLRVKQDISEFVKQETSLFYTDTNQLNKNEGKK